MPLEDMSAAHIAAQLGHFEPQRANNALLHIAGLRDSELVTLSLETFPIPKTQLTPIELNYLNERRKVAGPANVAEIDVVLRDWVDNATMYVLMDWFQQTYDPYSGRINLASRYKKRGTITLYGPEGGFDREFICTGLWITQFDPGDIDMTSEDKKNITITLSVDKVIPGRGVDSGRRINPGAGLLVNTKGSGPNVDLLVS
jgi:hypothetical protein